MGDLVENVKIDDSHHDPEEEAIFKIMERVC